MTDPLTELRVDSLGPTRFVSPLAARRSPNTWSFTHDGERVIISAEGAIDLSRTFEKAGPRESLFFDPTRSRAAIATCGGLCPGINNAVRSLVLQLHHVYGVPEVLGIRDGFGGLVPDPVHPPVVLGTEAVRTMHPLGGSVLGSSRHRVVPQEAVDVLVRDKIDMLFLIGGEGTLRAAANVHAEVKRRGLHIAIVCIPKTIDNDIPMLDKTFGFETAVDYARLAIDAAHTEATGAPNGVGVVKLMGRDSGFIAAAATLASAEANFCLIPEFSFDVRKLLSAIEARVLSSRGHAVVVVAEGCGAALVTEKAEHDDSGNIRYASADLDIGQHLRDRFVEYFKGRKLAVNVKYIDPSYTIRSAPANGADSIYSSELARHAVHAAMAGKTNVVVGRKNGIFVHVPIATAITHKRRVDHELWRQVCEVTGQPALA
jgi:6-phosphofructokinase 1